MCEQSYLLNTLANDDKSSSSTNYDLYIVYSFLLKSHIEVYHGLAVIPLNVWVFLCFSSESLLFAVFKSQMKDKYI